jgi:hypothetical protein
MSGASFAQLTPKPLSAPQSTPEPLSLHAGARIDARDYKGSWQAARVFRKQKMLELFGRFF